MPTPAFKFVEYIFLALLYLFLLRILRAVWVELREPRIVAGPGAVSVEHPPGHARSAPGLAARRRDGGATLRLVVAAPEAKAGEAYDLGSELTIGRASGCAVPLPSDNFVSQVHARVFRSGDGYWVEDLGSTNGTLLNGRKITEAVPLRRGDRLQVGRTVLELRK